MLSLRSIFVNSLRLRDCMFSTKIPYPGDKALIPTQPENSKVDCAILGHVPEFDQKLISHLEKLSLIRFTDEQAVASLRSSVHLALGLQLVDVTGVAPMYTVWENQECPLHDDIPEKPLTVEKVLSNASKRVDDFLVSPPGNIPLDESEPLDLKVINQWDKLGVSPTVMHNRRVMFFLRAALFITLFYMAVVNSRAYSGQFGGQYSTGQYPAQFGNNVNEESVFRGQAEYAKRRPAALRNCFLSPVQCLLPVDNQRFNKFHKRFFFDS